MQCARSDLIIRYAFHFAPSALQKQQPKTACGEQHRAYMARPPNVGVLALEVFLPRSSVRADALEQADGCPGKYVKGLGQVKGSL
jgi:hypothetical protein